ncbi:hypothetical protein LIA77_08988 [Sarocladium implicatum]|nr:hypothetical protein LIA77_08988 [Sarocladium implicatum]
MDPTKTSIDSVMGSQSQGPVTLILNDQTIHLDDRASTPLYHLSRSVTALQQEPSAIQLDSLDRPLSTSRSNPETCTSHLFYLVHPINAQWRTDKPAYYATSVPDTKGSNFILQPSRSMNPLHKTEFTVLESPGRTAADEVLFANSKEQRFVFTAKRKRSGERHVWHDDAGREIATDEGAKGGQGTRKLIVTEPLDRETMYTLVGAWCLRVWHDVAESKEATRNHLEDMTPPQAISGENMKWSKRTGGMAGLAGLGAGGGM